MSVENYNSQRIASTDRWSLSSRIFHWGSVLLLIITWLMIMLHNNIEGGDYMSLHKAFGASVLFWMLARVVNRLLTRAPADVAMPLWQKLTAHATHLALYGLLIAMPVAGILMSVYGGRAVSVFGLFDIPVFVEVNRSSARFYNDLHTDIIWPLILLFTFMHIAAALYHQFVKKDGLLQRMR